MMAALATLWGFAFVLALIFVEDCPDARAFLVDGLVGDFDGGETLWTVRAP
jgi:hypothetical protein